MRPDYNDIVVFTHVVRHNGFSAAARVLGLPVSGVSRRVARLEAALGYVLLNRTTRRVGLTEAGRLFFERTGELGRMVEDAQRAIAESRRALGWSVSAEVSEEWDKHYIRVLRNLENTSLEDNGAQLIYEDLTSRSNKADQIKLPAKLPLNTPPS